MKKFTPDEVKFAKTQKDLVVNGLVTTNVAALYMAGEIVMWDEMQNEFTALQEENDRLNALVDGAQDENKGLRRLYKHAATKATEYRSLLDRMSAALESERNLAMMGDVPFTPEEQAKHDKNMLVLAEYKKLT